MRQAYNECMKSWLLVILTVLLAVPAWGQRPVPPGERLREMTPEERVQWREQWHQQMSEARRQRREAWQQMSPEERHQLRQDIRDAGREVYPRRPQRRRD